MRVVWARHGVVIWGCFLCLDRSHDISRPRSPGITLGSPSPQPVQRAIHQFNSDISLARRRHNLTNFIGRAHGASRSTMRRMEKDDRRVPIRFFARALRVFGEIQALE